MAEKRISAKAILIDIRAGISNEGIGRKYGLSAKGMRSVFDKLLAANLLSPEEHRSRLMSSADPIGIAAVQEPENGGLSESPHRNSAGLQMVAEISGRDIHDGEAKRADRDSVAYSPPQEMNTPQKNSDPVVADFIDVSEQGKNQWWRYVASILFILIFPIALEAVALAILLPDVQLDATTGRLVGIDPFDDYLLMSLGFVLFLVCILLSVRFEHKRPVFSLITANPSINWKRLAQSFGLFFGLLAVDVSISYAMHPETFQFTLNPGRYFILGPLVLMLTPIQAATEEIFFRGYLLQMTALLTRNRWVLVFSSGLLFLLPHVFNPEVASGPLPMCLYYFACGSFLALITLKSNGLEPAIGIHAANNLFAALIVNYANSPFSTESIFVCTELKPVLSLLAFCIGAIVFYLIVFGGDTPWDRLRTGQILYWFRSDRRRNVDGTAG